MTQYTNRIAFLAPAEHAEACNRAANAIGRSGGNFTVRLSDSGQEPVTHLGGSAVETDAFLSVLSFAPELPPGMGWPEYLAVADWQTVADHLIVVSGPAATKEAQTQFADLLATHGLQAIVSPE